MGLADGTSTSPVESLEYFLLPCPFCGGPAEINSSGDAGRVWRVHCRRAACDACGPIRESQLDAAVSWNRPSRAPLKAFDTERFLGTALGAFLGTPEAVRQLQRVLAATASGLRPKKPT